MLGNIYPTLHQPSANLPGKGKMQATMEDFNLCCLVCCSCYQDMHCINRTDLSFVTLSGSLPVPTTPYVWRQQKVLVDSHTVLRPKLPKQQNTRSCHIVWEAIQVGHKQFESIPGVWIWHTTLSSLQEREIDRGREIESERKNACVLLTRLHLP